MKFPLRSVSLGALALASVALCPPAVAAPKSTLTFQPGARIPDQLAQANPPPAATATPSSGPAATPVPAIPGTAPIVDPAKTVQDFFTQLQADRVDAAYEQLLQGTKIAESERDVSMLKRKTREAIHLVGAISGYDLVETKDVGTHLKSFTYLSLGKSFPLRWRFYFYKAADTWKLIDIRISDRLSEMFGESGSASGSGSSGEPAK